MSFPRLKISTHYYGNYSRPSRKMWKSCVTKYVRLRPPREKPKFKLPAFRRVVRFNFSGFFRDATTLGIRRLLRIKRNRYDTRAFTFVIFFFYYYEDEVSQKTRPNVKERTYAFFQLVLTSENCLSVRIWKISILYTSTLYNFLVSYKNLT